MNVEPHQPSVNGDDEIPDRMSPVAIRAALKPTKAQAKVYSVPRRFGIGTIMGVALACALFVSAMQMLEAPPLAIVVTAVFLAIIAGCQAIFTTTPRSASITTGIACTAVWTIATMRPSLIGAAISEWVES